MTWERRRRARMASRFGHVGMVRRPPRARPVGPAVRGVLYRALFAVPTMMAAFWVVTWRQSTVKKMLEELTAAERELEVATGHMNALWDELSRLETREWLGAEAERRLGLRPATQSEVVYKSAGAR